MSDTEFNGWPENHRRIMVWRNTLADEMSNGTLPTTLPRKALIAERNPYY